MSEQTVNKDGGGKELLRNVSKDIISMQVNGDKSINDLISEFYAIMKKHGITRLTKHEDGSKTGHAFEYTICKNLFTEQVKRAFDFMEWGVSHHKFKKVPKSVEI